MKIWNESIATLSSCLGILAALGTSACSGGEHDDKVGESGTGPLYLLATNFSAGDQNETYLVTSKTFDADTKIDPTNGPKLLGGIVPTVHGGAAFVPDANGPILLRYQPGAKDRLEPVGELSFAGVGMTEIMSWHVWVQSETKGYVFDPAGLRIVIWDPSQMELTGKQIDLSELDVAGWLPNLVFEHSGPVKRGEQLLVPVGWVDQDTNSRYASGVITLDTKTDEVVDVAQDERCGEAYANVIAPNGDAYFFPPDWSAMPHFFADMHRPTCVLRIKDGETKFDSSFDLNLSVLGSGSAAAGAVPDGKTGFFFTTVDEELWDGGANKSGAVWRFWHYDFVSEKSRPIESMPAWAGQPYYVNVGGARFIPYWSETNTGFETTLYAVDGGDDPRPLFSFEANWFGAGKLRD